MIIDKLNNLTYPCVLVIYGPSWRCEDRTDIFEIKIVDNQKHALDIIQFSNYLGDHTDLSIYSVPCNDFVKIQ